MAVSKKSHMKRWVVGGLIAVFAVVLTAAFLSLSRSPDANQSPCRLSDSEARPIPFKRLSGEDTFPFLKFGRPISFWNEMPDYDEYRAAIVRFPDVNSCLAGPEKINQIPNLALFDWDAIKRARAAEVCLFRVFSSIGSFEGSEMWLKNQGFKIGSRREIGVSDFSLSREEEPGTAIEAYWPIAKCGVRFSSSLFDELGKRLFAYRHWIGAVFSADGEVITTSVILDTE